MKCASMALALSMLLVSCQRERRDLRSQPAQRELITATRQSSIVPGGPIPQPTVTSPVEGNAYAISQGMRLFSQYNCVGCHFHGGGGIGPPLMKKKLNYGSEPRNIFETIVEGRPNGMPSWGGRIPEDQIWQIVAYVRSLGGEEPAPATPGRSDEIEKKTRAQLK